MATPPTPPEPPRNLTARIIAPLALVAVTIAVIAVVSAGMSDSDDGGGRERGPKVERTGGDEGEPKAPEEDVYVVEPGDTLSGIAEKTGIPIERLARLNPDLDPQSLNSGQTIKLR